LRGTDERWKDESYGENINELKVGKLGLEGIERERELSCDNLQKNTGRKGEGGGGRERKKVGNEMRKE
jgi:hypothetical protein